MNKGMLFVVSGPSGVGKGTICKRLLERRHDIRGSVSCATRAPREGETHGVEYYFVSRERFDEMIQNGELLEYATVHGNSYGTPRAAVERTLAEGHDVILEIDVQGGRQVACQSMEMTRVFILPPSLEALSARLRGRGTEADEQIRLRLRNSADELLAAKDYDYIIVNDELEEAVRALEAVIMAQHLKREHSIARLDALVREIREVGSI